MSLSHTAAEYMLSDALLPDPGGSRAKGLRLELPSDRLLKFVTVGLPLFLVSLAFAREFSTGEWGLFPAGIFKVVWVISGCRWKTLMSLSLSWCEVENPVFRTSLPQGYLLLIVFNGLLITRSGGEAMLHLSSSLPAPLGAMGLFLRRRVPAGRLRGSVTPTAQGVALTSG